MVVIIGSTGFIGMYTVERFLKEGTKVFATGRNPHTAAKLKEWGVPCIPLDISREEDFDKLPTEDVEAVILLGGLLPANSKVDISREENAEDYIRVNVIGTIHVLEYCRKNGIKKMITCSSYADVCGAWKKGVALKETEPRDYKFTGDHAVYVISKNAAGDIVEYYNQQHGLSGAIFRLPPVYGVGPHGSIYVNGKLYKSGIQTFIEKARKGEPIEIWGDPHISRDIIYVKDVADAFAKAVKSEKTRGLYNMTSGTQLELEDQVKAVIEVFGGGKQSEIVYRPDKPNNTPSFLFDMTKAKEDFGFVPQYTSYKAMMEDYRKELESGRWNVLSQGREKEAL